MTPRATVTLAVDDAALNVLAQLVSARLTPAGDEWLDVCGAARHLACSANRVYRLVHERRIPVVREGRRLLFSRHALDEWLKDGIA